MKKKKGFTLVELLAVIVILAVILIIAMPKISDVIKNSKESSLETTAKLIASQAEKKYTENQVLDNSSTIKCSDVAKISDADYESCNITFDSKGNAKVTIVGKGKFEGMAVCNANKNNASISSDCSTDAKYFSYEEVEVVKTLSVTVEDANKCISYLQTLGAPEEQATTLCTTEDGLTDLKHAVELGDMPSSDYKKAGLKVEYTVVDNVEVKDVDKCTSYIQSKFVRLTEEQATTLCNGNTVTVGDETGSLKDVVSQGGIPASDYETAGLNVTHKPYVPSITITGYNIEGGTDIVIPSQIDGKTVVAIADYAFTKSGVIPSLTAYNNDYKVSLLSYNSNNNYVVKPLEVTGVKGLGITSVIIPNTVTSIGGHAFEGNNLINVEIPSSISRIGDYAFAGNKLTNVEIPSSISRIGDYAFAGNKLTNVEIPSSITVIGNDAFAGNKLTNVEIPSSITGIGDYAFAGNPNIVITNNSSIENTVGVWRNIVGYYCGTIVEGNIIRVNQYAVC